ncbi:magnesium transporter [Nakamurella sp. UYEF19]|uniref:magnesium transporter CorA family protein n=1 Tax=Nakamurella sp. UYEF19 TaxID=1756392 RepID=UPI00339AE37F
MTGRIWTEGKVINRDAEPSEVGDALSADHNTRAWFFLPRHETAALGRAAKNLGIDELAIEDLLGEGEPIKLDWIGSSMVAVLAAVAFDEESDELTSTPVSLLAGPRALIVLAGESMRGELCHQLDKAEPALMADGVPAALHTVVDHIVDGYLAVLQQMEDEVDKLSESLFDDKPLKREEQLRAFRLRRSLAQLRRAVNPLRDIASGLANAAGRAAAKHNSDEVKPTDAAEGLLGTRSVREFSDVADHAEHAAQMADGLRDVISSMYETNLALADVHLNTVMKKLTGWAAIIAVPTLITGFMGMNVPYPGFQSETGFIIAFIVMILAVSTLFITLRRKDWI